MDMSKQAARGLVDIEAYLYQQAHVSAARQRLAYFTQQTDGLTHEQKEDIERWYLAEQRYVAHMVTEHIAESITTAREEHRIRFGRWLRGTLIAMILITTIVIVGTTVVVGTLI